MRPRQSFLEIFSTFLQFDGDRFSSWATDPKLHRSMEYCLARSPQPESSEHFWALYWHKAWQAHPSSLARGHLSAYLQETCYWSVQKTRASFTSTQYSLSDCFQAAIARTDKVLKGFNPTQGSNLKNYASITFSNLIREFFRQRQEVDICTNWGLLRKLSQKRLVEALKNAGLSTETINRHVLAWNCLKTIYVPTPASSTRKLPKPDDATWQAIAQLYNTERRSQLHSPGPECSPETLEEWMLVCAKAARAYLYPTLSSLNTPRPGQESGEQLDQLVGDVDDSLLSDLMAEEESQTRQTQQAQINTVLISALAKLDSQVQQLLELYYAQGLTQQEMAERLSTKQYTISRRFSKARQSLLLALAQWSQDALHISLTSDVLKHTSAVLEEWLARHYCRSD